MPDLETDRINLQDKTCPKREDRLATIKTYLGTISGLVKESKVNNRKLEQRARTFEQTSGCLLTQTVGRLVTIRDSVLVIHGPVGCAQGTNGYREMFQNIPLELGRPREVELATVSSNLTEQDVVFGGEKKLKQAILLAVERYQPKSVLIATSCASGVMGDDIQGVVSELQPSLSASLVPIFCEGFRSRINQTAFDASAHAIVKYLVKPPRGKQRDLVNIIAPFSVTWSDRMEIDRLFSKVGLRARYVPDFASTEELETMSEAAVTAPTCASYGYYLQKALYEKYGVPYFREPAPLGLQNSARWFREIAKHTGKEKEIEALIKEEVEFVTPQLESLKQSLAGKDASIFVAAVSVAT